MWSVAVSLWLLFTTLCLAQTFRARVEGIVTDESSAVVAEILEHDKSVSEALQSAVPTTSVLTLAEAARAIVRAKAARRLTDDAERTAYRDLRTFDHWKRRDAALLGLASWDSTTIFHQVDILEITGTGVRTR